MLKQIALREEARGRKIWIGQEKIKIERFIVDVR